VKLRQRVNFFTDPLSLSSRHLKVSIENKEFQITEIQNEIAAIRSKEKEVNYGSYSKLSF
jgi:hypothetical protein